MQMTGFRRRRPRITANTLFRKIDVDGNGFISAEELHRYLVSTGNTRHSLTELVQLWRGDVNGDGRLSMHEFRQNVFPSLRLRVERGHPY